MNKRVFPILLLLVIILPITFPLFKSGFFSLQDETHIVDLYEMFRSINLGGFPPRWAPDFNFGIGHPYFNFYYHLPFYLTYIFMSLGLSMIHSFKIYLFFSVAASSIGFYFFTRKHFSVSASMLSAVLYVYTPYFAVDLYVRGALGELALFALIPWSLWSIRNLTINTSIKNFIVSSLLIGLLSLAHNVWNIFIFPLIFLYGLIHLLTGIKQQRKKITCLASCFIIGLVLTSYYWLPALMEKRFISEYEQIKIEDQFPFIKQLIIPHWGYGPSHWGPNDDISFQIGIVNLLAVILSVIFVKSIKSGRRFTIFFLAVFTIAVVLMNYRTLPFWNLNPTLRYFQFPWRLLLLTSLASSFLLGSIVNILQKRLNIKRHILYTILGIFSIVVINVWYFQPSQYKEISDERYLELYFANRTLQGNGQRDDLSKLYLNFSEDFIPPTKWQKTRMDDVRKNLVEAEKGAQLSYIKNGLNYTIDVSTPGPDKLVIYSAYFPGWTAIMDGKMLNIYPTTKYGVLGLDITPGKHKISVFFKDTPVRAVSNFLSITGGCLLIAMIIFKITKINRYHQHG